MTVENYATLSLGEVDNINLKMGEALSMAQILSRAAMGDLDDAKLLYTYTSMLEEKMEQAKELFNQATSKKKEAA
jgi:hypothetical protein